MEVAGTTQIGVVEQRGGMVILLARAAEAKTRNAARLLRMSTKFTETSSGRVIGSRHSDMAAQTETTLDAFGTSSADFVEAEISRLLEALRPAGKPAPSETDFNAALAVIDGSRPDDEIAAMLASQMAATHALAMHFIGRTRRADTLDGLHASGAMATRLLRTFTMQTEAIAKLKRGGAQTVRVEHVHVHGGGQAIVGNVGAGLGGEVKSTLNASDRQTKEPLALRTAPRCFAKTRGGKPCQRHAAKGKRRCRLHGGADGIGAPSGKRNGNFRHGLATKEAVAERRALRELIRAFRATSAQVE